MQGFFIVVCIFLGLSEIVESNKCISEDEIYVDKLIAIKMDTFMKKYDRKISLLENKIHSQGKKIQNLEDKCSGLLMNAEEKKKEESVHWYAASNHSAVTSLQKNPEPKRPNILGSQKRVVPGAVEIVAFCAYLTTPEINPSMHHIFVFDTVKTNIGSAYNKYSGMFTAPSDGVFVFSWTILGNPQSYIISQIVVNSQAFTSLISQSEDTGDVHSSTGVIVVSLDRGDLVHIRTHSSTPSVGSVLSHDVYGQPSFSGWKL